MKKLLFVCLSLLFVNLVASQVSKIVNVTNEKHVTINNTTAGGLAQALLLAGNGPLSSITHLTITGNLNSIDIGQMKNNMTVLSNLDITNASIENNTLPDFAFTNKTTLIDVKLPNNLTSIGNYAFYGCSYLSNTIPLPTTVINIGNYAYYDCYSINGSIDFSINLKTIGTSAFQNCSSLTGSLVLPNTITSISQSVFNGCSGFTGTLILPNTLTNIPVEAFSNCTNISGINIPNSATTLSSGAFSNCNKLSEITLGKNIISLGDYAFSGCNSLKKINVERSIPPTIQSLTFNGVDKETCHLYIPIGSLNSYLSSNYWGLFIFYNETALSDTYGITIQLANGGEVKENNVILGNGSVIDVAKNTSKIFTITPIIGYEISTLTYNGTDVKSQIQNNQYTTPAVNANTTLSITFQKIQYKLSIKDALTGAVNLLCDYGSTPSFDFAPANGWKVNTVIYNGNDVTNSLVNGIFTTPAITVNSLLNVSFVADTPTGSPQLFNSKLKVYVSNNKIVIDGTTEKDIIILYTLSGKQIQSVLSDGERLDLPVDKDGIYLVKIGEKSYKVVI
jgi:hypothetical protein